MDNTLKNAAVNKLAPTIKLTSEQEQLVERILHFCQLHLQQDYPALFTIYGDAGTGKSVVLSHGLRAIAPFTKPKIALLSITQKS